MASSLPVVATRVNGTREVVQPGETGFLVELGDSRGLAEALSRLIHDPELRTRMGRQGRTVAEREYDENAIIDTLRAVYRSALLTKGITMGAAMAPVVER
jgi:glycosyltransferase involved in cell wall biosynthesis